jgi:hypothetical protein
MRAAPVQLASRRSQHAFILRSLVSALFAQLPRSGGNHARRRFVYGAHNDLPSGLARCPELEKPGRPHLTVTTDSWRIDETDVRIKGV